MAEEEDESYLTPWHNVKRRYGAYDGFDGVIARELSAMSIEDQSGVIRRWFLSKFERQTIPSGVSGDRYFVDNQISSEFGGILDTNAVDIVAEELNQGYPAWVPRQVPPKANPELDHPILTTETGEAIVTEDGEPIALDDGPLREGRWDDSAAWDDNATWADDPVTAAQEAARVAGLPPNIRLGTDFVNPETGDRLQFQWTSPESGVLTPRILRRSESALREDVSGLIREAEAAADLALSAMDKIQITPPAAMGHNGPPEAMTVEPPVPRAEFDELKVAFETLKAQVAADKASPAEVEQAKSKIYKFLAVTGKWLWTRAEKMIDTSLGEVAKKAPLLAVYVMNMEAVNAAVGRLVQRYGQKLVTRDQAAA